MAKLIEVLETGEGPVFALGGEGYTYALRVTGEGLLEHLHYGSRLGATDAVSARIHRRVHRDGVALHEDEKGLTLGDFPQEYPVGGASDYRHAALEGETADGLAIGTLRYAGHRIEDAKPDMAGLPGADGAGSTTLVVEMSDRLAGLRAELRYTVWAGHAVLARSVRLRNDGSSPIRIGRALSACFALPPGARDVLHLHGSWAREFAAERVALPAAQLVVESARGTSSAAHHPFMALMPPETTEEAGPVLAATLVYSGNHRFTAERGEFGDARLSAGLSPTGFSWLLEPGEAFVTPEALSVWTDAGLGGMSAAWHDFIRTKITPSRWRSVPRPTYLNTWESSYFAVDEGRVLALADKAAELGLDMLVLDDGWFAGRTSDAGGLGTWRADPERFPGGIPALAKKVRDRGLRFGLWFESEMASPDSIVATERPERLLGAPGRKLSLGRNQLILDLGRDDVRDDLFGQLSAILSCGDVAYVKWDMNRPMTETGSAALPASRQREAAHRYMLGLYDLLGRLTRAFPDVLFETCASGGNRFDLGMLSFCPQGWISDMVDPIGRARIVSGASLLYPPDVMASYIGPSPNHQNGRLTSLDARYHLGAVCAAQGLSLSREDLDRDAGRLMPLIAEMAERAPRLLGARFHRLIDGPNAVCWQTTSADGRWVDVVDLHILSGPNQPLRRVRLRDLEPDARYRALDDGSVLSGRALMAGFALPQVAMMQAGEGRHLPLGDFATALLRFERVAKAPGQ